MVEGWDGRACEDFHKGMIGAMILLSDENDVNLGRLWQFGWLGHVRILRSVLSIGGNVQCATTPLHSD